jgi:hypothetical protein
MTDRLRELPTITKPVLPDRPATAAADGTLIIPPPPAPVLSITQSSPVGVDPETSVLNSTVDTVLDPHRRQVAWRPEAIAAAKLQQRISLFGRHLAPGDDFEEATP